MDEEAFALILQKCLDAVERGGDPQAVTDRYPVLKDELLPLIETAMLLRERRDSFPHPREFLADLGRRLRTR